MLNLIFLLGVVGGLSEMEKSDQFIPPPKVIIGLQTIVHNAFGFANLIK